MELKSIYFRCEFIVLNELFFVFIHNLNKFTKKFQKSNEDLWGVKKLAFTDSL